MSDSADGDKEFGLSARWRVIGGVGLLIVVIVVMWLLVEHDASGDSPQADATIGDFLRHYGYLVGFALIYIEESGPPLFIPGDAFLLYVGHRLPRNVPVFLFAFRVFVDAVPLVAT